MIKLLTSVLMAVAIQPYYQVAEIEINDIGIYHYYYDENSDSVFYDNGVGDEESILNFYVDSLSISNYYSLIELTFEFNQSEILKYGGAYINVWYDELNLCLITYYFDNDNQNNLSRIVGKTIFTPSSNVGWSYDYFDDGDPNTKYLYIENEDIEQAPFYIELKLLNQNPSALRDAGYYDGYGDGYDEGYNVGEQIGYNDGYNVGFVNGQQNNFGIEGFFRSIFNVIDNVGQIEIFPSIKLWYIVAIPLIFGVLAFIIGLFR